MQPSTRQTPTRSPAAPLGRPDPSAARRWGVNLATAQAPTLAYRLLGGVGTVRSRILVNGMHLPAAGWKYAEYVWLDPGSSCGRHHHTQTGEIYVVVSGRGRMEVGEDDDRFDVELRVGDLVCVPVGTVHGVAAAADQALEFLVVEVYPEAEADGPRRGPTRLPVRVVMDADRGDGRIRRFSIDLRTYLGDPWRSFELLTIPAGATWSEAGAPSDTVMLVIGGALGGNVDGVDVAGEGGWCAGLPAGSPWELTAGADGVELVTVQVAGG